MNGFGKTGKRRHWLISLRRQVLFAFSILLVPVVIFVFAYSIYTMGAMKASMADNAQNTLFLYKRELESSLKSVESNLLDVVANNSDYQRLYYTLSDVETHLVSYAILDHYKNLMSTFEFIGAMYIVSDENELFRGTWQGGYSYRQKLEVNKLARELVQKEKETAGTERNKSWTVYEVGDRYFLVRIIGFREVYCDAFADMELFIKPQNRGENREGRIVLHSSKGEPYGETEFLDEKGIELKGRKIEYDIVGKKEKFLVVSEPLLKSGDVWMAYLVPFHNIFSEMNLVQILMLVLSLIIILLIPACYFYLKRNLFYPLSNLTETMNQIREGKVDAQMNTGYRNREFHQVSVTFNAMVKQIGDLKIAAYESELKQQRAKLQYLQQQLRPHFFLNCLKNLFGLAQGGQYQKIQNMILEMSDYLRYTFRDGASLVTIEEEKRHVEHYITLQKMSSSRKLSCSILIKPELSDILIPPLTMLTFVENAVKHADPGAGTLEIQIKAILLSDEGREFLNLTIKDNGKGYSDETLKKLGNQEELNGIQENQVGIRNISQRVSLLYHGEGSISFSNQEGACTEIFLPVSRESGKEG